MSSTPRAKPTVGKEAPSPRAVKPAAGDKAKKKKPKGSAAPSAPVSMDVPMDKPAQLSEEKAKEQLQVLQTKYAALVVNFNNQQEELKHCQAELKKKEDELEMFKEVQAKQAAGNAGEADAQLRAQLDKAAADLRRVETDNMALQKKVNKLQVEHVSEEEVDQLFYALEKKEEQLEQALGEKEALEAEVLTARQLTARGTQQPQIVEIHHHNTLSDDDDDDEVMEAAPASAPAVTAD